MLTSRRVQCVPLGMLESGVPERDLEIAEKGEDGLAEEQSIYSASSPRRLVTMFQRL